MRVQPDQIVESVDASLKRLGTDYIDLLQVMQLVLHCLAGVALSYATVSRLCSMCVVCAAPLQVTSAAETPPLSSADVAIVLLVHF